MRQLEEHGPHTLPEGRQGVEEALDAALDAVELALVGDADVGLDREPEGGRHSVVPGFEGRGAGAATERVVGLNGGEKLGVGGEHPGGRGTGRIERADPILVRPTARSHPHLGHRQ